MNSVGSASPLQGSPKRSPVPFKGKVGHFQYGAHAKNPLSPNKRKIIDLSSEEAQQDLDKLERDLQKLIS